MSARVHDEPDMTVGEVHELVRLRRMQEENRRVELMQLSANTLVVNAGLGPPRVRFERHALGDVHRLAFDQIVGRASKDHGHDGPAASTALRGESANARLTAADMPK